MQKVFEWTFAALLVAVLTVPFFTFSNFFFPFITSKAFVFRILVELAVVVWAYLAFSDSKFSPKLSPISISFGVFTFIILVADLFGVNPLKSIFSNFERMEGWITIIHLFAYVFMLESYFRAGGGNIKKYLWWALIFSTLISVHGMLQAFGLLQINQSTTRVDAGFGNAAYFAAYLLFNVFLSLFLAAKSEGVWRALALIPLILYFPLLFLTETRGAVFGVFAGLFVTGLLAAFFVRDSLWKGIAITGVVIPVVLLGGLMTFKSTSFVQDHNALSRIANVSLKDVSTRSEIWGIAWRGFLDRPLLGYGQEGFNIVFNRFYEPELFAQEPWFDRAHNSFVDWAMAGGILGLLGYLSLWAITAFALWRRSLRDRSFIILFGALVAYGIHSFFVFDNLISYIMFGVVLAYVGSLYKETWSMHSPSPHMGYVAGGVALALVLILITTLNVPSIAKNQALIRALQPAESLQEVVTRWQQVFAYKIFLGTQEAREQLVQLSFAVASTESISIEDRGRFAEYAASEMKKEVEEYPEDARTLVMYATILRLFGQYDEVEKVLDRAIALSPKKQRILFERGNLELLRGNPEGAVEYFKKAYDLAPQFDEPTDLLAAIMIGVGKREEGEKLLLDHFGTIDRYHPWLVATYEQIGDTERSKEIEALKPAE
jgi:O-antigen ligase